MYKKIVKTGCETCDDVTNYCVQRSCMEYGGFAATSILTYSSLYYIRLQYIMTVRDLMTNKLPVAIRSPSTKRIGLSACIIKNIQKQLFFNYYVLTNKNGWRSHTQKNLRSEEFSNELLGNRRGEKKIPKHHDHDGSTGTATAAGSK